MDTFYGLEKRIEWIGNSKEQLLEFPSEVIKSAGFELGKVQNGDDPTDFKPISDWGSGVIEIRLEEETNAYRVIYVAKFEEAVYVLHSFQKKSQQTSQPDVAIIKARYKGVVAERRKNGH